MKIFGTAAEQPDADIQARDDKDQAQDYGANGTIQPGDQIGQHLCAVGRSGEGSPAHRPDMGQRAVDDQQQPAGNPSGRDGVAHNALLLLDPVVFDIQHDDDAIVERHEGVHGLVSVGKSLCKDVLRIASARLPVSAGGPDKASDHNHQNQEQQARGQNLPDAFGEFFRAQGDNHCHQEEDQRIDGQHPSGGLLHKGSDRHFKGSGGRSRNGQPGADGQIHQDDEHGGKFFPHPSGKLLKAAGLGHGDYAQHREPDGRDGEPDHGDPGIRPRLCADKRREDQIPRAEEQAEQSQPQEKNIPLFHFFNYHFHFSPLF